MLILGAPVDWHEKFFHMVMRRMEHAVRVLLDQTHVHGLVFLKLLVPAGPVETEIAMGSQMARTIVPIPPVFIRANAPKSQFKKSQNNHFLKGFMKK